MEKGAWALASGAALLALPLAAPLGEARSRRHGAPPACGTVEVVDPGGRPIAGAEVYYAADPEVDGGGPGAPSWSGTTNVRGRACDERLLDGGFLTVDAPALEGGRCVGERRVEHDGFDVETGRGAFQRVVLATKRFIRWDWQGRVVSADGLGIAGATVVVENIAPSDADGCVMTSDRTVTSAPDGTVSLSRIPLGHVSLRVSAPTYATGRFQVEVEARIPQWRRVLRLERSGR